MNFPAPFGITNNTQQALRPITSITKVVYKMPGSSCALARLAGGASGRA